MNPFSYILAYSSWNNPYLDWIYVCLFIILPISILWGSWKRLHRIGWEWCVFADLVMLICAVLLIEIVYPRWVLNSSGAGGRPTNEIDFIFGFALPALVIQGFSFIHGISEQPVLPQGKKWLLFRSLAALYIVIVIGLYFNSSLFSQGLASGTLLHSVSPLYGWLLSIGAIAFIATQGGVIKYHDQEKIAVYQKQMKEKHEKKKRAPEVAPEIEQTKECPHCGMEYRISDYDPKAVFWGCSSCKKPLPRN